MKKVLLALCTLVSIVAKGQLLGWAPEFAIDGSGNILITCDVSKGNQGLLGHPTNDVYVHTGVITNLSSSPTAWRYVKNFGNNNIFSVAEPQLQATSIGNNKFTFNINNIRAYYGVPTGETILKIAILFRSGNGTKKQTNSDASDMYIPVYQSGVYSVRLNQPFFEPRYIPVLEPITATIGSNIATVGVASAASNLTLTLNGTQFASATGATSVSGNANITASCDQKIVLTGVSGANTAKDSAQFVVAPATSTQPLPAGVRDGINYGPGGTSVTLVLAAPGKNQVFVVGSFSNWTQQCQYLMNKTPDGTRFWTTINGITPGQLYTFQYNVDGITIADPYCELILDPQDDPWIPTGNYPGLPAYPPQATGVVGVFQSNAPAYNWASASSYVRPDKRDLRIYELLLRDFLATKRWSTLIDTLNYIKKGGYNAIEIMPFNEFEGNSSWGYNPYFYFVPEKSYGPKAELQRFIDSAHKRGIAVIMDVAFNHVTGKSPLAQLYWNSATNQPLPNNPWLNVTATHPFSVFNDFNHESEYTKLHVSRFIRHWLTEYKLDGFRWDLSKGFSQRPCAGNQACWDSYDASRIAIWKRYYDTMAVVSPGSYCILEHFGGNTEETELANYGMMPWGIMHSSYRQNQLGFASNSDINGILHNNRGYSQPHLVGFAVSHDEERLVRDATLFGNQSNSAHDARSLPIALARAATIHVSLMSLPGPKMLWQFDELGYDKSINTCSDGVTINNNCRTDPKPILWSYFQEAARKNIYNMIAAMNNLREQKLSAFRGVVSTGTNLGNDLLKTVVINDATLKMVSLTNFDVVSRTANIAFPTAGTYYDYLAGGTFTSTGTIQSITLNPGEYKVYTDQYIPNGLNTFPTAVLPIINPNNGMGILVHGNPISSASKIIGIVPETGKVSVDIIQANGVVLNNLFTGIKTKGEFFVPNTDKLQRLNSGMYFVRITQNGKTHIAKIIK